MAEKEKKPFGGLKLAAQKGLASIDVEALKEKAAFSFWEKADEEHTVIRLATSWATTEEQVDELLSILPERE